jgi:hypothetical protein
MYARLHTLTTSHFGSWPRRDPNPNIMNVGILICVVLLTKVKLLCSSDTSNYEETAKLLLS